MAQKKIDFISKLQVGYSNLTKLKDNVINLSKSISQLKTNYLEKQKELKL